MLNVYKHINDGVLSILLEGRLDTTTSPILEKELNASLADVSELVLDLEQLTYISSSGLRILLYAQKTMTARDGKLTVKNVCDNIMDVLEVTGFADILTIE